MRVSGNTLDDVLFQVLKGLLSRGRQIKPSKGAAREVIGAALTLKNPRARFSRAESRSIIFSCLGEFLWYLSGSNSLKFIKYYIPAYGVNSDDGNTLFGAYGPRLFLPKGSSQFDELLKNLREKSDSRQAILQLFRASDLTAGTKDVPCTTTIQFFKRRKRLHALVSMRSNDAFIGLPHDIFSFTMLQELLARSIDCEVGTYHHFVGSLHLYESDAEKARRYIAEGFQRTTQAMPPMPAGDPSQSLRWLQLVERKFRNASLQAVPANTHDNYWNDLARLLLIKAHFVSKNSKAITSERKRMRSAVYNDFIVNRQQRISKEAEAQQLTFEDVGRNPLVEVKKP